MTGLVYKSTGSWYTVKSEEGTFVECRIKGKFRVKGIKSTNPIAVGDIVDFELDETSDVTTGTIYNIHDRKNYIVRKSVNLSHQMHIIASNLDYVFLLITIDNPPTTFSFIDRFLGKQIDEIKSTDAPIWLIDLEKKISVTYQWKINGEEKSTFYISRNFSFFTKIRNFIIFSNYTTI